jgi:hypothetical protein
MQVSVLRAAPAAAACVARVHSSKSAAARRPISMVGAVGGDIVGIPNLPPRPQRAVVLSRARRVPLGGYMATRQTPVKCSASSAGVPRAVRTADRERGAAAVTRAYASDPYGEGNCDKKTGEGEETHTHS